MTYADLPPEILEAVESCEVATGINWTLVNLAGDDVSPEAAQVACLGARAALAAALEPYLRDAALGRWVRPQLSFYDEPAGGPDYRWGLQIELANWEHHALTGLYPEPAPDTVDEAVARLTKGRET